MSLSREEDVFLRHWMYDEQHFLEGQGRAKRLQVQNQTRPADLAILIAAAYPDLAEQGAAGEGPPPDEPPEWPWSNEVFAFRLAEAESLLRQRGRLTSSMSKS